MRTTHGPVNLAGPNAGEPDVFFAVRGPLQYRTFATEDGEEGIVIALPRKVAKLVGKNLSKNVKDIELMEIGVAP